MNRHHRPYDIILLGATGFTGQLTAEYLLKHQPTLKLALAGRNGEKLEQVRLYWPIITPPPYLIY